MKTLPSVAERCSRMRSGIGCSFPPGLCSRESHPVANMSSGDSAAAGVAAAFFAGSCDTIDSSASQHTSQGREDPQRTFLAFAAAAALSSFFPNRVS